MDLGEVGLLLVTRGEEEARRAIEDYVRASDDATRSLEENAQRIVRAEEARERAIQRQIKTQMEMVREATNLRRAYEDLSASFSKMEKATLDYYRTEELLNKALKANVISETEHARVLELVTQRMIEAAAAIRVQDEEARIALQERANAELAKAKAGYDSIIAAIDPAYAANLKYAESLKKISDAAEIQAISEQQRLDAMKLIENQLQKDLEAPRVRQMERERSEAAKLAQEQEQLANEYARLTASVNPAVRAQQMYDAAINTLNRSLKQGIITQDQYNSTLSDVHVQMERAGHTVNQFGQVMTTSERSFSKFAKGGLQQVGYQVGDFFVQMQSGTDILVAFGQQGAQLAGIFGATGALIGAGIAIVSMLGSTYLRASVDGKKLSEVVNDMNSSFQQLNGTIDQLSENEFAKTFGAMHEEIKSLTKSALALDSAMSLKNMTDTLNKLKKDYVEPGFFQELGSYLGAGFSAGGGYGIAPSVQANLAAAQRQKDMVSESERENFNKLGFDMGFETFQGYQKAIDEAAKSGDLTEVTKQLSALFVDAAPDIEHAQAIISSGGYEMLDAYRQLALAVAEANAKMKEYQKSETRTPLTPAQMDRASDERLIASVRERYDREFFERYKAFNQDRVSDERLIATVRKRDMDEARAAYKATNQDRYADEKLIHQALVKSLMDAYRAGKDLTKLDLPSGIDAAATVAAELAKQLNISLETAQKIVGLGKGRQEEIIYDPRQPGYDPQKAYTGRIKAMMEGAPIYEPPKPDKKKSGGSKRDPMEELRAQIKLEQEMLGLTEEQQRVYQALGEDRSKYSKTELDALAAEIKAIEDKKKAMEDMQSISDTIQSSMADAFMSMVDGTATVEDAFKNMARAIIAQLYQVMVVQQLVGQWNASTGTGTGLVGALMKGISGITAQANGGAWSNGNQIHAFADGGVVMSPTMFGMAGGKRGLMGEAGPEAILPLKRTSNGKLGVVAAGGASSAVSEHTHIHNNFNISGSDPETVRREIDKAIPRIAEVSKAAVLDSRRRGGKMMATFG